MLWKIKRPNIITSDTYSNISGGQIYSHSSILQSNIIQGSVKIWTWTNHEYVLSNKIEVFELVSNRRIFKISYTYKITNLEVLRRIVKERELPLTIKRSKILIFWTSWAINKYQVVINIIQGRILGRRSIGRRQISWLQNTTGWRRNAKDKKQYYNI